MYCSTTLKFASGRHLQGNEDSDSIQIGISRLARLNASYASTTPPDWSPMLPALRALTTAENEPGEAKGEKYQGLRLGNGLFDQIEPANGASHDDVMDTDMEDEFLA